MALYILKEIDPKTGRPFDDDDTTEYFDDADYNGDALQAATDSYDFRVAQTDAAWGAGTGKDRWTLLRVGPR